MRLRSSLRPPVLVPTVVIAVTLGYLATALWSAPPIENDTISASFFPVVVSTVMLVACGFALVGGVREAKPERVGPRSMKPVLVVLLTGAYVAAFDTVGYFVSTTAYALGLLFVLECRFRNPVLRMVIAVAIAIAFYLFYAELFRLRLPTLGEFL